MAAPLLLKDGIAGDIHRFDIRHGGGGGTPAGPENERPEHPLLGDPRRLGLWLFLGTVSMLFIGFTSALLVRRASADWIPLRAPALVWWNTAALLASSAALEGARRGLRRGRMTEVDRWIGVTGLLGLAFVAGQLGAWKTLAAQGVFLDTNPSSSFFYMLTGAHGVHVVAALIWFSVVLVGVRRRRYPAGSDALGLFATFWHFLAGLWAYVLFVLFVL